MSRWNKTTTGHWIGVIRENVWRLKQTDVSIECEILPLPSPDKDEEIIQSLLDAGQLKKKSVENVSESSALGRIGAFNAKDCCDMTRDFSYRILTKQR